MTIKPLFLVIFVYLFSPNYLGASELQSGACSKEKFHQFDFLIGEWRVTTEKDELVGNNSIRMVLNGCALSESWQSVDAERGESLIFYDSNIDRWHQTWIDNRGSALRLQGGVVDGQMLLSGQKPNSIEFHEIRWQPLGNGKVRQHWRMSLNNGKTWVDRFIGYYTPQNQQ